MEKLVCGSCSAPIAPNTTDPFLTCEYCDTSITNPFYAAPAVEEKEEPVLDGQPQEEQTAESPVSTLAQAVGGVARTLLQRSLLHRSLQRSVKQRPIIQRTHAHPAVQHVRPPRPSVIQPRPRMQHPHGMRPPRGGAGRPMGGGRKPR